MPREHLHLTLAFAGTIPEPRVACLRERIGELQTAPIPLHLDRLGHFARARVTWIGPRRVPAALEALATRATELCSACGTPVHTDVFRPHVTLRRYASHPEHEIASPPVDWDAREVVLIESGDAGRPGPYRILARTGISSSESPGS